MDPLRGRPEISYPCEWTYRVIVSDEAAARAEIGALVGAAPHSLARLGESSGGRYVRLELLVTVRDEAHRNELFAALARSPSVRFVL